MKAFPVLLVTVLVIVVSCKEKAEKSNEPAPAEADSAVAAAPDTSDYLPVSDMLKQDMLNVETYGAGILKKVRTGNNKDSNFIQYPNFKSIASQFFLKELDSAYFRGHFSETPLVDQSSGLMNFIYTAKDSTSSLRQVIVYVAPTETANKIDRIYMETASAEKGAQVEKKLTWKMGKYFYVLTSRQPQSGDPKITLERLIWDPQHYADN